MCQTIKNPQRIASQGFASSKAGGPSLKALWANELRLVPIFGGITPEPYHMVTPLPRIGGAVPLADQSQLCSKCTPVYGGWVTLNPFSDPLIRRHRNQKPMVENLHCSAFVERKVIVFFERHIFNLFPSRDHILVFDDNVAVFPTTRAKFQPRDIVNNLNTAALRKHHGISFLLAKRSTVRLSIPIHGTLVNHESLHTLQILEIPMIGQHIRANHPSSLNVRSLSESVAHLLQLFCNRFAVHRFSSVSYIDIIQDDSLGCKQNLWIFLSRFFDTIFRDFLYVWHDCC